MHGSGVRRLMPRRVTDLTRGTVVLLLAGALIGFLFDTAVHSVHHLESGDDAPPCWVALIAGCLGAATPAAITIAPPVRRVLDVLAASAVRAVPDAQIHVARDRAPPASILA